MPVFYLWHCVFSSHKPRCTWTCGRQSERKHEKEKGRQGGNEVAEVFTKLYVRDSQFSAGLGYAV